MELGVHLAFVDTQGESDVICSFLRINGIRCAERSALPAEAGATYGGRREILVSPDQRELALDLLAGTASEE